MNVRCYADWTYEIDARLHHAISMSAIRAFCRGRVHWTADCHGAMNLLHGHDLDVRFGCSLYADERIYLKHPRAPNLP